MMSYIKGTCYFDTLNLISRIICVILFAVFLYIYTYIELGTRLPNIYVIKDRNLQDSSRALIILSHSFAFSISFTFSLSFSHKQKLGSK